MTELLADVAVKAAAGIAFSAEFLFVGYPLVRRYLRNRGFLSQLFYSHVLSASLMIIALWAVYTLSRDISPLIATTALLVFCGIVGTVAFFADLAKRRPISNEVWGYALLILVATVLVVSAAFTLSFTAQGDAYGYYVPIGRYLNQNPGGYVTSYYRFSLSRNFAYYAVYAHADILGGSFSSFLFLPLPFITGTILGVISLTKRLTRDKAVPLLAASCYIVSVYFGLILRYNMFYLGNLLMATMGLFLCYFLLAGAESTLEKIALPFSIFAMLLLYDFTLLLLVPLAFGYIAHQKPRLVFYVAAALGIPLSLILSQQSLPLGFAQIHQLNTQSSIVFLGLVLVVLAGVWSPRAASGKNVKLTFPTILAYAAAIASVVAQRLVNLATFGFMSVDNYTLSTAVITYMQRGYWGYQTPPNIPNTLLSIFFSNIFLGWGLFFTVLGLFLRRGSPIVTFVLTTLPLIVLVETINDNYFRFAIFLVPLIVVFLSLGIYKLLDKKAFFVTFLLSLVALFEESIASFPDIDYVHRAIADPVNIELLYATIFFAVVFLSVRFYPKVRILPPGAISAVRGVALKARGWIAAIPIPTAMKRWQLAGIAILILCLPLSLYNVLAPQHFQMNNITDIDAAYVDQQLLPLIQAPSTVLTVELIHPNFNFYKDVTIIQMAQPWILESFLRLHLGSVSALVTWLSQNGIRYVFVDRGLTEGNEDVFGLFDQLAISCYSYSLCIPSYSDGRFVLLEITT